VLDVLLDIIAVRTGYGKAELDPAYELEADLGIDTVKQAEIFGEVRDRFGLPREEGFKLSDYPTIQSLVGWVASRLAAAPGVSTTPVAPVLSSAPAAPVPSAAAAVAVAVVDRAAIEAAVLGIIARRTGYEAAELDPDFELEADLGIDTVKQAEVFGEVREHFQIPRDDRFKLSDYPTIKSLVGWLEGKLEAGAGEVAPPPAAAPSVVEPSVVEPSVVEPSVVEPSVVEPSVAPAAAAVVDRAAIEAAVLGIIARRTGYEAAELDPDFELEADLGIDTVKQAEVFGEVREHFQIPRDDRFKLSDYPTIKSLVGWLEGKLAAAAAEVAPPAAEVPPPASDDLRSPWQELPSAAVEPASASILPVTPLHPVPLAEPPRKVLPAGFRLRRPVLVPRAIFPRRGELGGLVVQVLGDGAFATALRAELQGRGAALSGKVDVVIDLSTDVLTGFQIARSLDAERPRHWLCATRLGADPSWSDPELALTSGARAGLCKALGREWPGTLARVVDLDPMLSDDAAARLLVGELGALDGAVEVYLDGDHRRVITLASEPLPPAGGGLRPNSLIVLSGGTRGITAEVAFELASRGPLRLVLLARSAPGEEPLVEALAKADIKAELEAGGGRATPGRIEARLKPLRAAEEARRTVARLRALGAEVSTLLCDLADGAAVQRALQQIRDEHGPIDGVIHGAGVEESRLLPDKDLEAFHRVFDGKALGGMALLRGLERDAFFVSMGSVAGRFGNAGQVDYSAANEAMARACLSRSGALHVDWTAWADVGMAVRGGMERLLTERGVELLPAGAGAGLLVDLVVGGVTGELVVAGRMGDFTVPALHPLLDHAELDGDTVIARRRLTLERDAWIGHHAIGGVPVLPGVIGLELMAAAATLVRPGQALVGAEDVRFLAPVKVHRDDPVELILRAEPDGGGVLVTLSSERLARTGRMLRTEHFRATLLLGEASPIAALPAAFFAEDPIDRDSIYARFFHGPLFQVLSDASAIAVDGLLADAEVNHVAFGGPLLTAPLVLEAAFQAAGLHRMAVAGFMALPSRIESLRWERLAADDSRLGIMVSTRKDGAYDVDVDGGGRAVLRLRGFHMIDTGPLPPGDAFPVPEGGWPRAVIGRTTKAGGGGELKALHPDEEAEIRRRGTPSRQADRRAGRRAARAAVEGLLGEADFVLRSRPSGAPEVTGIDPAPAVSITHTDGEALAVAVFGGRPGIDQEVVRLRAPSFAEDWFTEGERALTARDPWLETAVWTVKEAIQKALGAGMRVHPREVEVLGLVGRRASVRLHGEALRLHEEQGGGPVGALLTGLPTAGSGGPPVGDASGDKVVATTLLRAGAPVAAASSPSLRSIA
jgi:NAD(P)-dependent dehydrogenase (short-subunit alcohol dehydrogenase family)/acyl carrier protein/phosphopantetheinyl transferase